MRLASWACRALLLGLAVGCNPSSPDRTVDESVAGNLTEPSETAAADPAPAPVRVDIKSWGQIQAWIAEQQGKVVVVDVWSTSCLPCVKEFPHFVQLHNEFGGDVACASVNLDYYGSEEEQPKDLQPRVLEFLTSKQATMQNFISSDPDEEVCRQISTAAIPAVLVYDSAGQLHTVFNNDDMLYGPEGFNYADDIAPLVKQLLQSGG